MVKLAPVALLAVAMLIGQATDQPPLAQILERVGHYVRQFEDDFAIVVSDEDYTQQDVVNTEPGGRRSSVARRLRSEMVFAWLPETQSWLAARHVLTVDGAPVADSKDRMDAALAAPGPEGRARVRRLRDEGAERGPPSLITAPASDLPSNGLVRIGRVDGTVVRTSLTLKDATTNTRADIVVDYSNFRRFETSGRLVTP